MAYRCLNHPERDAIGICVKCRKYLCVECATKIAGVNYCADCLPSAKRREQKQPRSWEKPAAALVTLVSLLVCSLLAGGFAVFFVPQASSETPEERWEENDEWMETIVSALFMFHADRGRYPTDDEGLDALLDSTGVPGQGFSYLDNPKLNAWGEIVDIYSTPVAYHLGDFVSPVIVSAGGDGEFQTEIRALSYGEGGGGDDAVFWVR